MERESGFDDGRAKFGRASDVSSAARERQEHSHEMGTPAATQELKFHQSQGGGETINLSNNAAVKAFKSNFERLSARHISLDQKLLEANHKKQELKHRYEQQQQTLLEAQMKLESISNQYAAEIRGRDAVVVKIQQNNQITKAFADHCEGVNDALEQMALDKDTISEQYSKCIQTLSSVEIRFRNVQSIVEETRNLQCAIQEQRKLRQQCDEVYRAKKEKIKQEHSKKMSNLNAEFCKAKERTEEMKQRQTSGRSKIADLEEKVKIMTQKHIEDLNEHLSRVNGLKTSKEVLEDTLNCALQEKAHLSTKLTEKQAVFRAVSESLSNSVAKQVELEKRREVLTAKLTESQARKNDVSMKIQGIAGDISHKSLVKEELRNKLEHLKQTSSRQSLEQKTILEDTLSMSAERKSKLEHNINDLIQQSDAKQEKCEKLKQEASSINDSLKIMMKDAENAALLNEDLKAQMLTKEMEKASLFPEMEEISGRLEAEKVRQSQLDSSFKQQRAQLEDKMKALFNDLEKIKSSVLKADENLQSTKANEASLKHNLQQLRENTQKTEEEVKAAHNSSIRKLEDKIAILECKKQQVTLEDKKKISELEDKENNQNQLLSKKEEELKKIEESHQLLATQIETKRKVLASLKNNIDENDRTIVELNQTYVTCEKELHEREAKLNELNETLQEKRHTLQSKRGKISELEEEMMRIERNKADAISENAKHTELLLCDINTTKQTCESLSSEQSTLSIELNALKKTYLESLKVIETSEKLKINLEEEIEKATSQIETNNHILDKLSQDFEISQNTIKQFKQEGALAGQVYQKLRCAIAAAKAKKKHKERASPKDSQNAPVKTDVDKPGTPNSMLRETSNELKLASVGTPEIKQSTPQLQITPRSILKTSKAPTPTSEIKRVSFIDAADSDGGASVGSTSSSIVVTPADLLEIARNPAAKFQIGRQKRELAAKIKGVNSPQGH